MKIEINIPDGDYCNNCRFLIPYNSDQREGTAYPQCKLFEVHLGYKLQSKDKDGVIVYKHIDCFKQTKE